METTPLAVASTWDREIDPERAEDAFDSLGEYPRAVLEARDPEGYGISLYHLPDGQSLVRFEDPNGTETTVWESHESGLQAAIRALREQLQAVDGGWNGVVPAEDPYEDVWVDLYTSIDDELLGLSDAELEVFHELRREGLHLQESIELAEKVLA